MSNEGLTVVDGSTLAGKSLPALSDVALTGAQVIDLADSAVSASLFGIVPRRSLQFSALRKSGVSTDDLDVFRSSQLSPEQALKTIELYIAAIADELKDDPIVVAVLDGKMIRMILEDEDEFAMIAENIFIDLDIKDTGMVKRSDIRHALIYMGAQMGVPSTSEFPPLKSILRKHELMEMNDGERVPNEEEDLGQAQFASSLQCVLQDLADALAAKNVVLVQNIKIANGSKLRKLLADEQQLGNIVEKMLEEKQCEQDGQFMAPFIRSCFEKYCLKIGLPKPSDPNDAAILLYDSVFSDVENHMDMVTPGVNREEFFKLVRMILEKFAEQLELSPVFYDLED